MGMAFDVLNPYVGLHKCLTPIANWPRNKINKLRSQSIELANKNKHLELTVRLLSISHTLAVYSFAVIRMSLKKIVLVASIEKRLARANRPTLDSE